MKRLSAPTILFALLLACLTGCRRDNLFSGNEDAPLVATDLSNQKISSFAEDEEGYVWIGTFRGLNRKGVNNYRQYFCNEDSLTIPDNQIKDLHKDASGCLWVATVNGIAVRTDQDCFKTFPLQSSNKNVLQILENSRGNIFVNTTDDLSVLDEASGVFKIILPDLNKNSFSVSCHVAPDDGIWIVRTNKMLLFDSDANVLRDSVDLSGYVSYSFMNEKGLLFISSSTGLSLFDTNTRSFVEPPQVLKSSLSGSRIRTMCQYGPNSLLICTEKDELYLYNVISGAILSQKDANFPFMVPWVRIQTLFVDSHQNVWIGLYDQGVFVVYSHQESFNNNNLLRTMTDWRSVVSLSCDSKGNLWIATLKDGLFVYNPGSGEYKKMDLTQVIPASEDGDYNVYCIFADDEDYLWLISESNVSKCEYSGGKLVKAASFYAFIPISISQDAEGTIWIGTATGHINYIRRGEDKLGYFSIAPTSYSFISSVCELDDENMLASTFISGPIQFNIHTHETTQLKVSGDDWTSCITRSVYIPCAAFRDSSGEIWLGTVANGLLHYSPSKGTLEPVPGAPCTDISSIEEDRQGNLWVSTQYGLGMYNKETKVFSNFFSADGIGGNQFNDRSSCVLPDGTLVFGGTHGLTFFNPLDLSKGKDVPVFFEDLKIDNAIILPGAGKCIEKRLSLDPDVKLHHRQNSFSISYTALEYARHERVRYFYMLEGFDKQWIDAGSNQEAYYANVPAGKYRFKVRVTNTDLSVVAGENELNVRVKGQAWLQWWAILLYLLVFAAIVSMVVAQRRKIAAEKAAALKEKQEKEQEKKINELNMNFFANVSHEFRTPLTMISGPVEQLQADKDISPENKRLLNIVQRNVRRMLRLVNQQLDFNKLENDTLKLSVKPTDIVSQMRYVTDIFKVSAEEKNIEFRAYGLEESLTVWADDDKLDKICFNLLSNALKFTPTEGKIEFSLDVISREKASQLFSLTDKDTDTQYVKIEIRDTGKGIPESEVENIFGRYYQLDNQNRNSQYSGSGIGLYFARALAELHHGHIKAEKRPYGTGAVFVFIFPRSESSYSMEEKYPGTEEKAADTVPEHILYTEKPAEERSDDKSILIVDDDADMVHYLKELFSPYYRVIVRFDAEAAYTLIKEEAVDVIVSDVVMPGESGYDLCRKIKDNIQISHIPVVLLTAKGMVENQVEGLDSGADAYVVKPFEPLYLLAVVASLVKNREKLKSLLAKATTVTDLEENVLAPKDNVFMTELYELMEQGLSNSELDVSQMTEIMHISRTKFYYKVKGLTGENPSAFFKRYKLNRAAALLKEGKYNISEVADMTGFSTLSHFSTSFKKQFGVSPKDYV